MTDNWSPAKTGLSRVFIIENEARADRTPAYHNFMRAGALEKSYGDVTKIEAPHPNKADQFEEIGEIQEADERPTTQIMGIYPLNEASVLKRVADRRCSSDIHLNLGQCQDVSLFNEFEKKLILEKTKVTNYATDELGALSSDERAQVNETADISMREWYEVLKLGFASRAGSIVTNEIVDVVICDSASCGDCEDPSDGCEKIFAVSIAAGGSPSTPADVVFSIDGGVNWYAVDIDTMGAADSPTGIACVAGYVVVIDETSNSLHYADIDDFDTTPDPTWTEVTTGFVASKQPQDIWSLGSVAFIAANGGYVYKLTDPTAGVTVLEAGTVLTDDLNAIHAISESKIIAVGNASAILKSENGVTFTEITPPTGVGVDYNAVWIKANNDSEWWLGTSGGTLYYTVNNGVTFTAKGFSGSGAGVIYDIAFASKSVGYLAHATDAAAGRIFRTYDGGYSWQLLPEGSATLPANDRVNALAACKEDVNFVVGVGLADNGSDGIVLVGED
jgi:hypothetical protein